MSNAVARVRLCRGDKHNGLDLAMFEALVEAGASLLGREDVSAVVLHGEGPSFCAGLDMGAMMAVGLPEAAERLLARRPDNPANLAQRAARVWQEVEVPVIAALHGAVFGGGLQLALGADLRYAAPDARLSVMEIKLGLIPDMAISQTLPRRVGLDQAKELTWTGRVVSAEEALALGLVTRVCADPLAEALALAEGLTRRPRAALAAGKRLFNEAPGLGPAEGLALEEALQRPLLGMPPAPGAGGGK